MRIYIFLVLIGLSLTANSQVIMSYNVENLFYPTNDSLKMDDDFTPEGNRRWTFSKYYTKLTQIAKVIVNVPRCPDIIGLNEVEESKCLEDLCHKMPHYPYKFIHFDSPDERGIDVAMLYDSIKISIILAKPISIYLDSADYTRDILYTSVKYNNKDTLHIFVCHLPSQLGGTNTSQWKRDRVKSIIKHCTDSILCIQKEASIIVCGDFNMKPKEDMSPLHNQMLTYTKKGLGTHKYQGEWTCLDQFYVSDGLVGCSSVQIFDASFLMEEDNKYLSTQPKRTFRGYQYNRNGYSDHLPILLYIK